MSERREERSRSRKCRLKVILVDDELTGPESAASSGALGWARHGGAIASYHQLESKVSEISAPMSWPDGALKD
jgi:hypothetical protein